MTDGRPTDHRGRYIPDGSWPPGRGAPEPLERVRRFINTVNRESGADHFETPTSLAAWMEREGYGTPAAITEGRRRRVVEVREALRELAHANHAGDHESLKVIDAVVRLDLVAARLPVLVRFRPSPHLAPTPAGVDGALASLLAATYDAMVGGTWPRLKACRNHHCRWTFYDHSRNGSGVWCSTAACGSRMKVRAHRARQRAARPVPPAPPPTPKERP